MRFIIRKAFRDRRIVLDTNEYERLVTLYLDCIYRIALNGCHNYMDAEDVVQNTFMKLLGKEEYFADDGQAKFWLIRVAMNECKSLWRTTWKRRVTSMEELSHEPAFRMPERSNLYYAVRELPIKYRQVVHLYYFEDYSVKEIADIMNLSETAVQNRLFRARQKLKEKLKEA